MALSSSIQNPTTFRLSPFDPRSPSRIHCHLQHLNSFGCSVSFSRFKPLRCVSSLVVAPSSRIHVQNPIVEMDGDEMARVIWTMIKDKLINPYIELDINCFDLGLLNRMPLMIDRVTVENAEATLKLATT